MKILIAGCGSIGRRHIGNLLRSGYKDLVACDVLATATADVEEKFALKTFNNYERALNTKPDVVFVCTPNHLHVKMALEAAKQGCNLFIEKPPSHNLNGVDALIKIVAEKNLTAMVGFNLRFHPSMVKIRELLKKDKIGKIIGAKAEYGNYLPNWRPQQDYRNGYAAKTETGGGVILDRMHEIDYITWLLGNATEVFCFAGKLSDLEIETEDYAEMFLKLKSGIIANIHVDYIRRKFKNTLDIFGTDGMISWEFGKGLTVTDIKGKEKTVPEPKGYDINQSYIDEVKHFLDCVKKKQKPISTLEEAKNSLAIALAAKRSAETGKIVKI